MTEPPPTPAATPARRALGVLVGLFAAWQLVYLPLANLIVFVPLRPNGPPMEPIVNGYQQKGAFTEAEPVQRGVEGVGRAVELWSEVSGQEQGWSLFAPGTPPYSVFVAAEFRWADGTSDTLLSQYEPRDYANVPIRPPLLHNRHYNFEVQFVYPVWYAGPQAAEQPENWADLPNVVRSLQPELRAWLGWRLRDYLAANPHRGRPEQVILKHRYISTPHPTQPRDAERVVTERPFARWWPATDAVDAYDLVGQKYVRVGAQP